MGSATDGRLTDRGYWDQVWVDKNPGAWSDLGWIRRRYSWVVWDRKLRARLQPDPARRFLEVGCGSAKWLIYFHRTFGYQVTGCDYSDAACEGARRSLAAAGVPGEVIQRDLFALTGRYDVICSYGLIEHFTDPRAVLAKFRELLPSPGGVLLTMVPNLGGLSGLYHRALKPETFTTHRPITLDELRRWYGELGLSRVEVGALGSVIPLRFPRDKVRRRYPRLYRALWGGVLRPATWASNRGCTALYTRLGMTVESPLFSPNLYAIGETA
jgi:SAM-dependent methyltransferase